jgi:hypothetical protein
MTMSKRRPGNVRKERRECPSIVERLVDDLLNYSQRFLDRHGLRQATLSIKLHEGEVVRVAHSYWRKFPDPVRGAKGQAANAFAESYPGSLTPRELNARIGLRVHRLVRHFGIRFGDLVIEIEGGAVKTFWPSPPLRPSELRDLVRLLDKGGNRNHRVKQRIPA